jgi:four helix bundle protein
MSIKQQPDGEASLDRKFSEMMKLINVYLNHFPKHERYALCNRIRNTAYDIYDLITEGQKRYYKKTTLSSLDIAHQKLRMQVYLAYELGYFRFKDGKTSQQTPDELEAHRYTTISGLVDELGRYWDMQDALHPLNICTDR